MQILKNSVVSQDVLSENMNAIQSFLRDSYDSAKKQFVDGVTFFKDEFSTLRTRTGTYLNRIVLPVNNFLKEVDQIDTELQSLKVNSRNMSSVIPVEVAAAISAGEENY